MDTHLLAQITNPALPTSLGASGTSQGGTVLGKLISGLLGALFVAGFLLTFMMLLISGIQWITAGGDKQALEKARNGIIHAIVGLIIVAAAWAVMTFIGDFLGIHMTALHIPSIGQ